jgi:hypothetical protein
VRDLDLGYDHDLLAGQKNTLAQVFVFVVGKKRLVKKTNAPHHIHIQ